MNHFLKAIFFGALLLSLMSLERQASAQPVGCAADAKIRIQCAVNEACVNNTCVKKTVWRKPAWLNFQSRVKRTPMGIGTSPSGAAANIAEPSMVGEMDAKILTPPNPNPIVEHGLDKELPICRHTAHGDDRVDCQMNQCKQFYRNTLLAVNGIDSSLTIPTFVGGIPSSSKCYVVPMDVYHDLILPLLLSCIHDPNKPDGLDSDSATFGSSACFNPYSSDGLWGKGFILVEGKNAGTTLDKFNNAVGTAWSFNTDDSVGICINQGAIERARTACEDNCCGRSVILPR